MLFSCVQVELAQELERKMTLENFQEKEPLIWLRDAFADCELKVREALWNPYPMTCITGEKIHCTAGSCCVAALISRMFNNICLCQIYSVISRKKLVLGTCR